jgi:hypothetical protein
MFVESAIKAGIFGQLAKKSRAARISFHENVKEPNKMRPNLPKGNKFPSEEGERQEKSLLLPSFDFSARNKCFFVRFWHLSFSTQLLTCDHHFAE